MKLLHFLKDKVFDCIAGEKSPRLYEHIALIFLDKFKESIPQIHSDTQVSLCDLHNFVCNIQFHINDGAVFSQRIDQQSFNTHCYNKVGINLHCTCWYFGHTDTLVVADFTFTINDERFCYIY